MGFFHWLKDKENKIKRFGDFISIIASCAAILLLVITILQISNAAENLKANTIYSIAKDEQISYQNKLASIFVQKGI